MILSIIIVNWNTRQLLANCLESIRETAGDLDHEIIVSDNGSTDGSRELCRGQFPTVIFLENGANLGFAAANNRGISVAQGDFLLLLNSDTIVWPGALQSALAFMKRHSKTGGLGCRMITAQGDVQRSIERASGFVPSLLQRLSSRPPRHKQRDYYDREHLSVDYVSGAFLLLRREALERAGRFDEQFFMYAEEADLCLRIRRTGFRISYTPEAEIVHLGGGSACAGSTRSLQRVVSRLRFLKKHRSLVYYQLFRALSLLAVTQRFLRGRMDLATYRRYLAAHQQLSYSL